MIDFKPLKMYIASQQNQKGKKIMNKMKPEMAKIVNEMYQLPFNKIQESIQSVRRLLKEGHDINAQNEKGDTLLHVVLNCFPLRGGNTIQAGLPNERENVLDVLYLTTQYHPNPFIKNNDNMTPSMVAAQLRHTNEWQLLSSYEQSYQAEKQDLIAKETGKALLGMLYFMANQHYEKDVLSLDIIPHAINNTTLPGVQTVYESAKNLGVVSDKTQSDKSVEQIAQFICKHTKRIENNQQIRSFFNRENF